MIIFLTTVRNPQNSVDYQRVEDLLARTIRSVCNQTNRDFRFIVVCNQVPQFSVPVEVDFVKVDFPPPSGSKGSEMNISDSRRDKGTKAFIGLLHARQYKPSHVMFIDADDLISNRIAEYVNIHPQGNGWYLQEGYLYGDGGILIRKTNQFHMKCGSAHIIKWDLLNVPADASLQMSQAEVLDQVDKVFLKKVLSTHRETVNYFGELGLPTKPLPFPGAIWILDTGENRSGKSLMSIGYPASKHVQHEFNLEIPAVTLRLFVEYVTGLPTVLIKLVSKLREKLYHPVG